MADKPAPSSQGGSPALEAFVDPLKRLGANGTRVRCARFSLRERSGGVVEREVAVPTRSRKSAAFYRVFQCNRLNTH